MEKKMVNVHEAKTQLSRLLEKVEAGEEIIIARAGKPVARLVPLEPKPPKRQPGRYKGIFPDLPDSFFFDPLPEDELKLWNK